tara:strand:+ start:988 stop:1356 length:369 start_codon:yes stop_codon:yes gene_type:complete
MKLAVLIILQMAMLNFVPPLIAETAYFNEVYYCIMYMLFTTTAVSLPYFVPELPKILKVISMMFAGWFFSSIAFNVMGIFSPEMLANINAPTATFTRYTLVFSATIAFLILNESWKRNTTKN